MDKPDLTYPSLAGLSYVLRNLEVEMPNHHYDHNVYNMGSPCGTAGCALGVAAILWPSALGCAAAPNGLYFGLNARNSCFNLSAYFVADDMVTPSMVADRIDEHLLRYGETRE